MAKRQNKRVAKAVLLAGEEDVEHRVTLVGRAVDNEYRVIEPLLTLKSNPETGRFKSHTRRRN